MRISLAKAPMPVAFGVKGNQQVLKLQPAMRDTVHFGNTSPNGARFIAPMVLENMPKFDANNPEVVAFYKTLMEKAQTFSKAGVSKYQVGVIMVGQSGRGYLGTNIEVKGDSPVDTVHGEGFATIMARAYKEKGVTDLILSGPPCGHCRQLLFEIGNPDLKMHVLDRQTGQVKTSMTHREFFPVPFDSTSAGPEKNLLLQSPSPLKGKTRHRNPLVQKAIEGALQSYLPKPGRKGWGGIALQMKDGQVYNGGTITVSGANPTIIPVQEALVKLVSEQKSFADIQKAVLVEPENPDYSFYQQTRAILKQLAPQARLGRVRLQVD